MPFNITITSFNPFRLFRRTNHKEIELKDNWAFRKLQSENVKLHRVLKEANNTLVEQEKLLAEYDCLLAHFQAREIDLKVRPFRTDHSIPMPLNSFSLKFTLESCWIESHWFCMNHDILCLYEGEVHWKHGNPGLAFDHVADSITTSSFHHDLYLASCQKLRCQVFIAALLHTFKRYEESNRLIDNILKLIATGHMEAGQRDGLFNKPTSKDIYGIAHYVQGKNLKELGIISEAYLSFSRALEVPHYHDKARNFQEQLIVYETGKVADACSDRASSRASFRTIYSQQGFASSKSGFGSISNQVDDYNRFNDTNW
ncbi:hypothetical protein N7448_009326 [Penicillium atrosanguineum]|uniref:uncharacterized protein n=1 Tax=Penicillium atrosanguineum TaxID=1132637 RepID=UPI0023A1F313|nr:uncharacterized protein N7443_006576 [Penicillium atrosanguineum]KAJ5123229.1 hypothetical protein N7448_009326 [Penicillium atrosanguineum]KAJ5141860.1 hypothetical protein N7526_002855 [Penicillium atrosanguineum]KAJ5298456.1 hypothetical protein N7443_006576 [Penicillium atrosanguineum]